MSRSIWALAVSLFVTLSAFGSVKSNGPAPTGPLSSPPPAATQRPPDQTLSDAFAAKSQQELENSRQERIRELQDRAEVIAKSFTIQQEQHRDQSSGFEETICYFRMANGNICVGGVRRLDGWDAAGFTVHFYATEQRIICK